MKTARMVLVIVIAMMIHCSTNAQWVRTNGPYGGWINTLYVNGTTVYAGLGYVPYGVFRSTDNGVTWENRGNLLADARSFVTVGSNLFVAAYEWGVHRSTNDGASWTFVSTGITSNKVLSLAALGSILFVSTQDSGVFSSTNNGANWVRTTLPKDYYSHLAVSGPNIIAARKTVSGDSLYVSTDNGSNWIRTATATVFRTLKTIGTNVFAGTFYGPLRSTDNGITWSVMNSGLNAQTWSFASIGTDVYATTGSALFKSTNNGTSWTNIGPIPITYTSGASLAALGTSMFYACPLPESGIYQSTDAGVSWNWMGLTTLSLTALGSNGTTLFTGNTSTFGGAVYRSTDLGSAWVAMPTISSYVTAIASHGGNVYASTQVGIYKSTTNGSSWQFNLSVPSINTFLTDGTTLYAVGLNAGLRLTTDNGITWISRGLQNRSPKSITIMGSRLYVGTTTDVYISSDGGVTWLDTVTVGDVNALTTLGSRVYAGTTSGIRYSIDNGTTWQNGGFFSTINSLVSSADRLYAATAGGIFVNNGSDNVWTAVNTGLSPFGINRLHINGSILYAAGAVVWKRPLSELVSVRDLDNTVPHDSKLLQNYPNPFNPSTTINFSIAKAGHTSLHVYDLLGRAVAALVNESLAAGTYEVRWDGKTAQGSPAGTGIYFYRLQAGSFVESKKMILLK